MIGLAPIFLSVGCLLLAGFCAAGAKVLLRFSHHQLESYCRRRGRLERYDDICDLNEQAADAAETLQTAAAAGVVMTLVVWLPEHLQRLSWLMVASSGLGVWLAFCTVRVWVPAAIAEYGSAPFLFHTWRFWRSVAKLLSPLLAAGELVDKLARRLTGQSNKSEPEEEEEFEEELLTMVNAGQREGWLEENEQEMIEGVFKLGEADVEDIMTPRSKIDALNAELGWIEMLRFVVEVGRTRIPVYEKKLDQVIGVLYVKDLFKELARGEHESRIAWRELLRPAWKIPQTLQLDQLLQDFLNNRRHQAVVVDEYDSIVGVVTIEDVLEEIVGEIIDESEIDREQEEEIVLKGDKQLEVVGTVRLDDLNSHMGDLFPASDDFDTINGLLVSRLGRIPAVGEQVLEPGVRLTVVQAGTRRVEKVLVEMLEDG